MNDRAQSSVIGPVLLVGVFVTVGVVAGGAVVTNVADQSTGVEANIAAEVEDGELRLTHMGGDSIATDRLQLLVRDGTTSKTVPFTDGQLSDEDTFAPGDVWRGNASTVSKLSEISFESGISVRLVTNSGDVVDSVTTVEEIVSTETPSQYNPSSPTATDTPTPESTPTPEPTPTPTPSVADRVEFSGVSVDDEELELCIRLSSPPSAAVETVSITELDDGDDEEEEEEGDDEPRTDLEFGNEECLEFDDVDIDGESVKRDTNRDEATHVVTLQYDDDSESTYYLRITEEEEEEEEEEDEGD